MNRDRILLKVDLGQSSVRFIFIYPGKWEMVKD